MLVEDNGPIHTSKISLAALAARAHWLAVEWLPKYAPELNDIEPVWRDLKAYQLAHQTFIDADELERAIHQAVDALNAERMLLPSAKPPALVGCLDAAADRGKIGPSFAKTSWTRPSSAADAVSHSRRPAFWRDDGPAKSRKIN